MIILSFVILYSIQNFFYFNNVSWKISLKQFVLIIYIFALNNCRAYVIKNLIKFLVNVILYQYFLRYFIHQFTKVSYLKFNIIFSIVLLLQRLNTSLNLLNNWAWSIIVEYDIEISCDYLFIPFFKSNKLCLLFKLLSDWENLS